MTKDAFSTYHPIVTITFFIGAFVFGMLFLHPWYLGCSLFWSSVYYFSIHKRSGVGFLLRLLPFYLFLSAINPVFNTRGEHILFTYAGGRVYTLEALLYGAALAAMLISVLIWFAAYQRVMTEDKLLYLSKGTLPTVSLLFVMVLRLLPDLKNRLKQIETARAGIGLSAGQGNLRHRLRNGTASLSSLTAWSLESGIVMSDSMKSRGYGSGRRSAFLNYHFGKRDGVLLFCLLGSAAVVVYCALNGGASAAYTPQLKLAQNGYGRAGAAACFLFLGIPSVVNLTEDIRWYILRSGI